MYQLLQDPVTTTHIRSRTENLLSREAVTSDQFSEHKFDFYETTSKTTFNTDQPLGKPGLGKIEG